MTDPVITHSSLFRSIVQATRESVSNLATSIGNGKEVEIAASTLEAILVLLQFHPTEDARQVYIEIVQQLLAGQQINFTPQQLIASKRTRVSSKPLRYDPMKEVADAILDYGKWIMEHEQEKAERNGDANSSADGM